MCVSEGSVESARTAAWPGESLPQARWAPVEMESANEQPKCGRSDMLWALSFVPPRWFQLGATNAAGRIDLETGRRRQAASAAFAGAPATSLICFTYRRT